MKSYLSLLLLLFSIPVFAQTGSVKGRVLDNATSEPVPFANVIVEGTTVGAATDFDGNYQIDGVPLGYVRLVVQVLGYEETTSEDVFVTKANIPFVELRVKSSAQDLEEVVIQADQYKKTEETPLSVQSIGLEEIEKNPGANRDISKVIQSFPGVASTPSFRNDIIIRGGAPNENRFYLDGVETPVINHFQTQGSSGGPVGMINATLLKSTDLYTGAFPPNRGNALSSVMEFQQIDGNPNKSKYRFNLGASEAGFSSDGPIGEKATYIVSVRQSYLQFLFSALKLPFLPTFTDGQFKVKYKIDDKNELTFIGLGALDLFDINENVNDGVTDEETLERNNYILGNIPVNEQWNYTVGAVYKHYAKKSFQTYVLSRNALENSAYKYYDNDENNDQLLDYNSSEIENKFRFENTTRTGGAKINLGVNLETFQYRNRTEQLVPTPQGPVLLDYYSKFGEVKYGGWLQYSKTLAKARLVLSGGIRIDGNTYNDEMANPINQFSPRLAASYALNDRWSLNFNTGRYFQLPPYTVMGYADTNDVLVNKDRTTYIQSDQIVFGVEHRPNKATKVTVEGFFKGYENYPFLLRDSISLANLGADFGVIGNSPTASIGIGRAYGVEFLVQRKSTSGLYGIIAYTWVRSEFQDKFGNYVPSSWDSRNLVTLTAGKKFNNNWEAGVKWRFAGGLPYTPFDEQASSFIPNWEIAGAGILDYNRLNSQRLNAFNQLDIRVDKTWFKDKWSVNLYLDIQNLLGSAADSPNILNVVTDDNGNPIEDPNNPGFYQTYYIENSTGTVLPTIGLIIDF